MSRALTPAVIAEDLISAMELGGWFGYKLNDDGETIHVEQYGDTGEIAKTYTLELKITENK